MKISDEIAQVECEFVPGHILLAAVIEHEGINEYQAASWFSRNIKGLNRLPMLAYNPDLRDFRLVEEPWASDIFFDLSGQAEYYGITDWDEGGDGYIGGWLSPGLMRFFAETGIDFPELTIRKLLRKDTPSVAIRAENTVPQAEEASNHIQGPETAVATRERSTLLAIIAALSQEAKISLLTPSKSAELIADITEKMGSRVAKRTIEEHLKKIPDALERRMK